MESTLISGYEISGIILTGEHLGRAEELLGEEPLILEFLVRTDGIIDSISLIFSLDSSGLRLLLGGSLHLYLFLSFSHLCIKIFDLTLSC